MSKQDLSSTNNLEIFSHIVSSIKSELADIAGIDVFSQDDLEEMTGNIDSVFGEGTGNALVKYKDENGYNKLLAKKIAEKFAGIEGSDKLIESVENALKVCAQLKEKHQDPKFQTGLSRIQVAVSNLQDVLPIAEVASALSQKTESKTSKKGILLHAQAQGYKELVSEFVKDAADIFSRVDNTKEPKHIGDLDGDPVKITSSLKQKLFEVEYPIASAIRKNIKKFTMPAAQRMDRSVRAVKEKIFNRGSSPDR